LHVGLRHDLITPTDFGGDRLSGFGVATGQISGFSIHLRHRYSDTLHYRASV